jgi:hypothetical protein
VALGLWTGFALCRCGVLRYSEHGKGLKGSVLRRREVRLRLDRNFIIVSAKLSWSRMVRVLGSTLLSVGRKEVPVRARLLCVVVH